MSQSVANAVAIFTQKAEGLREMTMLTQGAIEENKSFALFKANKLFGGLDGLRFFCIFAVVWHHSIGEVSFLRIARYGFLGVDLFFVISGFLIVTLLLREREKKGNISLKSFYIRRALRIFPLYYGFLLAMVIVYTLINRDSEFGKVFLSQLPIYFLYLANFLPVSLSIVWSLAAEQQFYLVWPLVEKNAPKYITPILIVALLANQVVNFQREALGAWIGVPHLNHVMNPTFTPILLGVGLAHLLHHAGTFGYCQKLLLQKYSALLWLIALIVTISLAPDDISGFPMLLIHSLMTLLVGSVVVNERNKLMPVLSFPPIARIGAISYGIYLFHIYALVAAEKILQKINLDQKPMIFILGFIISILVAELSYRFYESPFLRLKDKFSVVHQNHA
jgi:peptidoglycan/LPS O-acetylase OafA/YrhL